MLSQFGRRSICFKTEGIGVVFSFPSLKIYGFLSLYAVSVLRDLDLQEKSRMFKIEDTDLVYCSSYPVPNDIFKKTMIIKQLFRNILGKGENAGDDRFLLPVQYVSFFQIQT